MEEPTYFLNQMWMRSPGGIAALMYGPSTLNTQVEGQSVTLHQRTNYPYEHRIAFEVETDDPVYFTFTFRVPTWAKLQSSIPVDSISNGYAHITRQWVQGDALEVNFESAPTVKDFKGRSTLPTDHWSTPRTYLRKERTLNPMRLRDSTITIVRHRPHTRSASF